MGFQRVSVLAGGLEAWRAAGLKLETLSGELPATGDRPGPTAASVDAPYMFIPSLAQRYLHEGGLPMRRRLATLFVDIAGSTRLLAHHPPEAVLGVVQQFMRLVTEVAIAYCGDVKDFEGDGALLYFESVAEATQAAFAIRAALSCGACGVQGPVEARMSLTVGDVVIGLVGSAMRQAISVIGPSVSVGARLLKQIPPCSIIAIGEVIEALGGEAPALARQFRLLDSAFEVPAADGITVATYVSEPASSTARNAAG